MTWGEVTYLFEQKGYRHRFIDIFVPIGQVSWPPRKQEFNGGKEEYCQGVLAVWEDQIPDKNETKRQKSFREAKSAKAVEDYIKDPSGPFGLFTS